MSKRLESSEEMGIPLTTAWNLRSFERIMLHAYLLLQCITDLHLPLRVIVLFPLQTLLKKFAFSSN